MSAEDLRRMAAEGWRQKDVAAHFGIAPQTLCRYMKREGISVRWRKRRMQNRITKEALEAVCQYCDYRSDAAKELGVTPGAVTRALKRFGVEKTWTIQDRPQRYDYPEMARLAVEGGLLSGNHSQEHVAAMLGIARQTLMRHVLPLIPADQVAFRGREPKKKRAPAPVREETRPTVQDYGVGRIGGFAVPKDLK